MANPVLDIFKDQFSVHFNHCSINGLMRPDLLLDHFQLLAGDHSSHIGHSWDSLHEQNLVFVLSRMAMEMKAYPGLGEELHLETWIGKIDGFSAARCYKVYCGEDMIGHGEALWVLLDLDTARPLPIQKRLGRYRIPESMEYSSLTKRLKPELQGLQRPSHKVVYSDLDMNQHVNNSSYLTWVMDGYSIEFLSQHVLKQIQINYLKETLYGQIMEFYLKEEGGIHKVTGVADGTIRLVLELQWESLD